MGGAAGPQKGNYESVTVIPQKGNYESVTVIT
jgi:hypothetical protein